MLATVRKLEKRLLAEFATDSEEWSRYVSALCAWEDSHLLENPTPEDLAEHKTTVERMLRFGRFLSMLSEHPDFPDRDTAEMVAATLRTLEDKLRMWHGSSKMTEAESDRILSACFPDES